MLRAPEIGGIVDAAVFVESKRRPGLLIPSNGLCDLHSVLPSHLVPDVVQIHTLEFLCDNVFGAYSVAQGARAPCIDPC